MTGSIRSLRRGSRSLGLDPCPVKAEMTMKILFIFSLYLNSAGVNTVRNVTGHRGHSVQIHCPYESGYESSTKYLCRGECSTLPWSTKDIPVDSGSVKDQRFSLKDDTDFIRVFIITITDLRTEDAGTYMCAIGRALPFSHDYTEIQLLVKLGAELREIPIGQSSTLGLNLLFLFQHHSQNHTMVNIKYSPPDKAQMTMKIFLIFSLYLISAAERSRPVFSGGGVLIKCRYETQYTSNKKFFCKSSGSNCVDQIKTGVKNAWVNSGRFSVFDDTSAAVFWVKIRDLTVEDSGTYQCAVDVTQSLDRYTPVELNVEEDPTFGKSISVTGHAGGSVNISCKYPQSLRSYPKFLCRRMGHGGCVYKTPVKESGEWINQGKYSLHDDRVKNTLSVIISDVREGDSGEFWCGAESDWESDHGYKLYMTHIRLTVTDMN
ncbi:polymeric immunoglobulin receptor-like isoform X2 [Hoplias malabaricus]|uniref:polymeric immunoglobulin receptor-like isoform X2 n=1 Tax=Hoplias malabaricus TaxID=27720 RepID=UPI003461A669